VDLEAVQSGEKLIDRPFGSILGVNHEKHVREAAAKVGAVRVVVSRALRVIDVHTLRTIEFHHSLARQVRQPDR